MSTATNTDFQKILEFNRAFGVHTETSPKPTIFAENPKLIEYRMSLIREEVAELEESVKTANFTETIDALTDIQYVVLGMYTALGVDADKAFDIVHKSNMSKLCKTEEEAKETVEWYLQNEKRYDSPSYRRSDDGVHWVVYNKSTSKILKSKYYTPANLTLTN